jgi:hypothetical protein
VAYLSALEAYVEIVLEESDDDYQGDTYAVVKKKLSWRKEFGYLTFGWGSCSGCDAWDDADGDPAKESQVITGILEGTQWFETLDELKQYITSQERELSYYYHRETWQKFLEKVAEL